MTGDQTLFHRADMVAAGWRAVEPILDVVAATPDALLHGYPRGRGDRLPPTPCWRGTDGRGDVLSPDRPPCRGQTRV